MSSLWLVFNTTWFSKTKKYASYIFSWQCDSLCMVCYE
uniref:Uncharacterized protein n=1 Tax=Anguilla anguilla TaxID=7936 RepID=A0A0E9RYF7_ANGAN